MTTINEALEAAQTELLTKTYPPGQLVLDDQRAINAVAADVLRRHIPKVIKAVMQHGDGIGDGPFAPPWTLFRQASIETERQLLALYPRDVFASIPRARQASKAATIELMRRFVPLIIGKVREWVVELEERG